MVSLSRPTVLAALATPAQLTSIRSWPCASRALAKAAATFSSLVTSTSQKMPPISAATFSPLLGVAVEDRDLGAAPRKRARRRLAEARCAAGDDRGNAFDLHFFSLDFTRARTVPSHLRASLRAQFGDHAVERRDQSMLHLHRFKGQQTLPFCNLFAQRNLDAVTLPGIGARIAPSPAPCPPTLPRAGKLELVGIALVEDDHALVVAKTGNRRELAFICRGRPKRAMTAERDARVRRRIEPEAGEVSRTTPRPRRSPARRQRRRARSRRPARHPAPALRGGAR